MVLSSKDQKSLARTWQLAKGSDTLGEEIFKLIFMQKPSLKRLWGLEKVPVDELASNVTFRRHSACFVMFLDICVRSICLDGRSVYRARTSACFSDAYTICIADTV